MITKEQAARDQIDTAIWLFYNRHDPISVHTLVSAGGQILRDLSRKRGIEGMFENMRDWIKPEFEAEYWRHFNRFASYFKHADRDPDERLYDFDYSVNDILLVLNCILYKDVTGEVSAPMNMHWLFTAALRPSLVIPGNDLLDGLVDHAKTIRSMTRPKQLAVGRMYLESTETGRTLTREKIEAELDKFVHTITIPTN